MGGGTPEAGPLPRGLRFQHDDAFGFRGDVSIALAALEHRSEVSCSTSSATRSDPAVVIVPLGPFIPVKMKGDVIKIEKWFCRVKTDNCLNRLTIPYGVKVPPFVSGAS